MLTSRYVIKLNEAHLRIARPARDLRRAEEFWVNGLGMEVLYRTDEHAEGGHALLMVGFPGAAWHLELVGDAAGETPPSPTEEDLLVIYVGEPVEDAVLRRLTETGGTVVPAKNPYWDRWGVTVQDPDGYRLVLSHRTWG
jgi:catechol 2,3-dioxygenase-like lactoylglutathione lyase family enzyme